MARVRLVVFAVAAIVLALMRGTPIKAAPQQSGETYVGNLIVLWGDPHPGMAVPVQQRFLLATNDGRTLALDMQGRHNEALKYFGKRVVVTGRSAAPAAGAPLGSPTAVLVDTIDAADPAAAMPGPDGAPLAVTGTKRVLFLLLKFADDASFPQLPSFYTNMTNPVTPSAPFPATINGFFSKTSGGVFAWSGTSSNVLTLPGTKSTYAPCGWSSSCFNFSTFDTDAVNVAKANGIDFTQYDNVNFVVSNDLDCCAWGGSVLIDGRTLGATWEPPWGQNVSTYSHEMGHSLGLPHSGWAYYAYDSPWDVMSSIQSLNYTSCGTYFSDNDSRTDTTYCEEPGDGYITPHKEYLGWIPSTNIVTTTTTSSPVTVSLEASALPLPTSATRLIKICLPGVSCTPSPGTSAHYFTVEARVKNLSTTSQFDNAIPGNGIIIHDVQMNRSAISGACYFNSQSGWAVPVDATPGDYNSSTCSYTAGTALYNAEFLPGQTYTNSTYNFRVNVGSVSGSTYVVTVSSTIATQISMDSPANNSRFAQGSSFTVSGWAINRSATTGTGVDAVHVYATPSGGPATFLGASTYGIARSDIGSLYGTQFTNSGYTLTAGSTLAPGTYTVTAYAHNATTGTFDATASNTITISAPVSNGILNIDTPGSGATVTSAFEVGGWAIDTGAPSGTGVDAVQFYVFPNGNMSAGVFIGSGSYGLTRGDVGALFGSRFTNSGYHFTITGLGPGSYLLGVYAHSTVTGSFSIVKTEPITVSATALMSIDAPSAESLISASTFGVSGWAIDRSGTTGTGIDAVHVYAYPNPGSGQPPIFLGVAAYGAISRPDVASLYGSRFQNSGYVLNIDRTAAGLTPGTYNIVCWAHSSVTGTFITNALVRVTLQ